MIEFAISTARTARQRVRPILEPNGVRLATEKVEIVLLYESARIINLVRGRRIQTGRHQKRAQRRQVVGANLADGKVVTGYVSDKAAVLVVEDLQRIELRRCL